MDFPKESRQHKSKQDLNLRFTVGYKGDFDLSFGAIGSRNFANDEVDGFVGEFFTFNKLKRAFGASNVCDPTDISPIFGLKCDVSGYLFIESDLNYPLAIDSYRINILVPVYNSATRDTRIVGSVWRGNFIVQHLGAISPSNRQCEFTRGKGTCNSRSFVCDLDSARTYHDIIGCVVEGNPNGSIRGNLTTGRGCTYEVNWDRFIYACVIIAAAASEH